jgi:hypothetical protein
MSNEILGPRHRRVSISVELLNDLLRNGTAATKPVNVPDDATVVSVQDSWHKGFHLVDVVLWSSTFDEVPVGAEPPAFLPIFTN